MVRTQIYLSKQQLQELSRRARATGRTQSQLIREAIDLTYREGQMASVAEALAASAGSWKRKRTGAQLVEGMRRGRLAALHK